MGTTKIYRIENGLRGTVDVWVDEYGQIWIRDDDSAIKINKYTGYELIHCLAEILDFNLKE